MYEIKAKAFSEAIEFCFEVLKVGFILYVIPAIILALLGFTIYKVVTYIADKLDKLEMRKIEKEWHKKRHTDI